MSSVRRIRKGQDALVVHAVVTYDGRASQLIKALKYDGRLGHARFLGHLLFRHLDRRLERHELDLVVANPTHRHRGVRPTELLLSAMAAADTQRRWVSADPADPCLVKARPTVSAYGRDRDGRWRAAEAVERALTVRRPELVAGRRLLVVDDVATTGAQLQAVARLLRSHGAADVQALVVTGVEPPTAQVDAGPSRLDRLGYRRSGAAGPSL